MSTNSDSSEYIDPNDSSKIIQHMTQTLRSSRAIDFITRLRQMGPHMHRSDFVNVVAAYRFDNSEPPSWFMERHGP
jgi:hypothetical protein